MSVRLISMPWPNGIFGMSLLASCTVSALGAYIPKIVLLSALSTGETTRPVSRAAWARTQQGERASRLANSSEFLVKDRAQASAQAHGSFPFLLL